MFRKIWRLFLLPILVVSSRTITSSPSPYIRRNVQESHVYDTGLTAINGSYYEVYTNMFVEITEQIDWQCVSVNVSIQEEEEDNITIQINKVGRLHTPLGVTVDRDFSLTSCEKNESTTFWHCKSSDSYGVSSLVPIAWDYTIRAIMVSPESNGDAHTILLTKDDNYSLYVWTKDVEFFKEHVENRVLKWFEDWDYNTFYKKPTGYGGQLEDACSIVR